MSIYTKGRKGKDPDGTGIKTACSRERDGMLLICPARGKLLQRAGQYLVAGVRMSCGGRQKTWLSGFLALPKQMQREFFLDAKIQKISQKCKRFGVIYLHFHSLIRNFAGCNIIR